MKPAQFTYHRARDVVGATALLADLGADAKIISGGQSLVPMMNFRLATPQHLVDVSRLRALSYLRTDDAGLHIGALTTHRAVETAPECATGPGFTVLRQAMGWIGHLPIRTRGTVGGSLAHADATAEWCLLSVLLDAQIVAVNRDGQRRMIPAAELFLGFFTTTLDPAEMIVEVLFPRRGPRAAITEFALRRGDFAIVAAAVDLDACRVVLGGVAPVPVRVPEAEAVLAAGGPDVFGRCADAAAEAIDPAGDANGSAEHRRALVRAMVVEACTQAVARG